MIVQIPSTTVWFLVSRRSSSAENARDNQMHQRVSVAEQPVFIDPIHDVLLLEDNLPTEQAPDVSPPAPVQEHISLPTTGYCFDQF